MSKDNKAASDSATATEGAALPVEATAAASVPAVVTPAAQAVAAVKVGVPSYMQGKERDSSMEKAAENVIIPRIKILQAMGRDEKAKDAFREGALYVSGLTRSVAEPGETATIVPLFHWIQWEEWADINDTAASGKGPVAITLKPTDEIALKARDKDRREEEYANPAAPKKPFRRAFVEALCYAVLVQTGPGAGIMAILSLSKSAHMQGRILNAMIGSRGYPCMCHNRIDIGPAQKKKDGNSWWVPEFFDPEEGGYDKDGLKIPLAIAEADAAKMEAASKHFEEMYKSGALVQLQEKDAAAETPKA